MKTFKNILYWFLIGIAVIQFIPIDRTNQPVKKAENFISIVPTSPKVEHLIKNACYDCHSNETDYPDYAVVAPLSWAIKRHVNEGREHLNFSEWATFNKDLKLGMLENAVEVLEQNTMPLPAYVSYHPEANLTKAERQVLITYFQKILDSGKY